MRNGPRKVGDILQKMKEDVKKDTIVIGQACEELVRRLEHRITRPATSRTSSHIYPAIVIDRG